MDENRLHFRELAEKIAPRLAGRPVTIIWRDPPMENALGQVIKSAKGEATVYLRQYENTVEHVADDWQFGVLLHELGHIRKQWDLIPAGNGGNRLAPNSVQRGEFPRLGDVVKHRDIEGEADQLANEWEQYAIAKIGYKGTAAQRMQALADWLPAELQTIVNRAVKAALDDVKGK